MRVIGFAGWSGAGKTTLIRRVIPLLTARGLRVSTIKHAHHGFDIDRPGKDSWVHREAGATEVLVASSARFALMHELRGEPEPPLGELLARLAPVDVVIVEGFKRDSHPKIEVVRGAVGKPALHPEDVTIVAIASDTPWPAAPIPVVAVDDAEAVAAVVIANAAVYQEPISPTARVIARSGATKRSTAAGDQWIASPSRDDGD